MIDHRQMLGQFARHLQPGGDRMRRGRDSCGPDALDKAIATTRARRTTPTADCPPGEPLPADDQGDGLNAFGVSVEDAGQGLCNALCPSR
jgi:hypothetical protein